MSHEDKKMRLLKKEEKPDAKLSSCPSNLYECHLIINRPNDHVDLIIIHTLSRKFRLINRFDCKEKSFNSLLK